MPIIKQQFKKENPNRAADFNRFASDLRAAWPFGSSEFDKQDPQKLLQFLEGDGSRLVRIWVNYAEMESTSGILFAKKVWINANGIGERFSAGVAFVGTRSDGRALAGNHPFD